MEKEKKAQIKRLEKALKFYESEKNESDQDLIKAIKERINFLKNLKK